MEKKKSDNCRLGVVGGQAVLEGVMMKHKEDYSVAVRKEDGSISVTNHKYFSVRKKHKIFNIPLIRGVVNMVEMMILSIRTLGISAEALGLEEVEESRFEKWLKKKFGKGVFDIVMVIGVILGLALSVGLFILLPVTVTRGVEKIAQTELGVWKNLIEGVVKIIVFIAYLLLVSLMKDIRRTFEYHGAEHKSVFCYESGAELTVENVRKFSRFHPRCGTSFLFVIIIISIFVSTLPFVPKDNVWLRSLTKFLLLPLVVGLGFEFIMYAGKHDNWFIRMLSAPGLFMQRITTKEPDDAQIEVAIYALKSAMPGEYPEFAAELKKSENLDRSEGIGETERQLSKDFDKSDDAAEAERQPPGDFNESHNK